MFGRVDCGLEACFVERLLCPVSSWTGHNITELHQNISLVSSKVVLQVSTWLVHLKKKRKEEGHLIIQSFLGITNKQVFFLKKKKPYLLSFLDTCD